MFEKNITISKKYENLDEACRRVALFLSEESVEIKKEEAAGMNKEIKYTYVDGKVLPSTGKYEISKKGKNYGLEICGEYSNFNVTLKGDKEDKKEMCDILDFFMPSVDSEDNSRIAISRKYSEFTNSSKKLNEILNESEILETKNGYNEPLIYDYTGESLLPKKGVIKLSYEDTPYKMSLDDCWDGMKVTIEGPMNKKDDMKSVLDKVGEGSSRHTSGQKAKEAFGKTWSDVVVSDETMELLNEKVCLPLRNPQLIKKLGIEAPKGVLLYGPPGCGKTLISKVLASESGGNFYGLTSTDLTSKWYGQTEGKIRESFSLARENKPSVIFMDELDGLFVERDNSHEATGRAVTTLLSELDGLKDNERVMFLAATNKKDNIDSAILRPGRIDEEIEIPRPDFESRKAIYKIHTRDMPLEEGVDFGELSKGDLNGAEIRKVCQDAGLLKIRELSRKTGKPAHEIRTDELEDLSISQEYFRKACEKNKL